MDPNKADETPAPRPNAAAVAAPDQTIPASFNVRQDAGQAAPAEAPSFAPDQSQMPTRESDWQLDSLLLFARHTQKLLRLSKAAAESIVVLSSLIDSFVQVAQDYYARRIELLEDLPDFSFAFGGKGRLHQTEQAYQRRLIIERIGREWSVLMQLISATTLLSEEETAIMKLNEVIRAAQKNVKLPVEIAGNKVDIAVLPHFGRNFELVKFTYAPHIFVIGIPVTSLYCPWEWTLIWHEIGGLYINHCADGNPVIAGVKKALTEISQSQDGPGRKLWKSWATWYPEIKGVLKRKQLPDKVIGDWAEEFVEDAFGILCLGQSMAEGLDAILSRYYTTQSTIAEVDRRHPPRGLRVAVAQHLVRLMLNDPAPGSDSGAARIAQELFANYGEMVHQPFSAADQAAVEGMLASMTPHSEAPTMLVAAATAAIRTHSADKVRMLMYGAADSHMITGSKKEHNRFQDQAALDQFVFSESDYAVTVAQHSHGTNNKLVNVKLTFSGVGISEDEGAHNIFHAGEVTWWHRH